MNEADALFECRVVITAPTGADANNINTVLVEAGFTTQIKPTLLTAIEAVSQGCGVLLLAEEAVDRTTGESLGEAMRKQLPWSDLPIIIITSAGRNRRSGIEATRLIGAHANLALIERPLSIPTLIAAVETALRARRRQYELRDLLADRQRLLASLEKRVEERTEKLQQMVEELEAFSYSVSHDLRSPLSIIGGYAQVLIEDHGESMGPRAQDLLNRIAKTTSRMDRLTQDLLAYTRISRAELILNPVDLDEVIGEVIEQYPSILSLRDHIAITRPLGVVSGHPPSLTQIFSNLIENALKFVKKGEKPQVRVSSQRQGEWIRVIVQDQGVGIAKEQHQRIFGIFERVSRSPFPGTGIGLAIAKKAVERMGGRIGVVSAMNQGATFWVDLKVANADEKAAGKGELGEASSNSPVTR